MQIAERLIKIIKSSNNFKLLNYKGQEEFYNEYMNFFDEINTYVVESMMFESPEYMHNYILESSANIRTALIILRERRKLTLTHFLKAYITILLLGDLNVSGEIILTGVTPLRMYLIPEFELHWMNNSEDYGDIENFTLEKDRFDYFIKLKSNDIFFPPYSLDVNLVLELLEKQAPYARSPCMTLVPFISKSGAYGYNTWLYLYFNCIYPRLLQNNDHSLSRP